MKDVAEPRRVRLFGLQLHSEKTSPDKQDNGLKKSRGFSTLRPVNLSALFSSPIRAIDAVTANLNTHAVALANGHIDPEHVVGLIESRRTLEVNLATLRTGDKMVGTLLDALA